MSRMIPAVDQATAGYTTPLRPTVTAAGQAGFPVVEVPAPHVAAHLDQVCCAELAGLLEATGVHIGQLSCGTGIPADLTCTDEEFTSGLHRWDAACRLAAAIDCPRLSVVVPRHPRRQRRLSWRDLTRRLRDLHAVAVQYGRTTTVELHDAALVQAAPRLWGEHASSALLLVDIAAVARAVPDPARYVRALPEHSIGWVHLADLPPGGGHRARVLPATGTLDLPAVLRALADHGYEGPVAVEVPTENTDTVTDRLHDAAVSLRDPTLADFFTWDGPAHAHP